MSLPDPTQTGTTGAPPADDTTQTSTTGAPAPGTGSDAGDDDQLSDEDRAMEAGFQATLRSDSEEHAAAKRTVEAATTTDKPEGNTEGEEEERDQLTDDANKQPTGASAAKTGGEKEEGDDPLIPGLNMKASEVRAALTGVGQLQEQLRTAHGKIGHLNSLVQGLGKTGKGITREQLKRVSEEFGEEFAEAFAADLSEAGFGGGQPVDPETVNKLVSEQVTPILQKAEWRVVRTAHKDAADYFKDGKHHQDFLAFVGTLPPERQEELMNSWDADVIVPALDEFKELRKKADDAKARQQKRIDRATAPTQQRAAAPLPEEDPMEVGYRNASGRRMPAQGARR